MLKSVRALSLQGPPFDNFVSRAQPERDVLPVKTPVILTKPQTINQVK